MQQLSSQSYQQCLGRHRPGACRNTFGMAARVYSMQQPWSSQGPSAHRARLAPVLRARLPHMDEELEHMQWQLDKRTHDKAAGATREHGSRHKAGKRRLVFHDGHSKHHQHHQRHHPHVRPHSASSSSSPDDTGGSSSSDEAAAAAGAQRHALQQQQQQQHMQAVCAGLQEEQFHCLHLDQAAAAAQDLHKAQERLAKHIQQDGGCAVSAAAGQAGLLTHLLLLLQHKQLHKKSSRWSDDMLLLLQPLSCEQLPDSATLPGMSAAASAAAGRLDGSSAQATSAGQHSSRSAVAHAGAWPRHPTSACPVDELRFFATFLPLHTLLSVERSSAAEAVAAGAGAAAQQVVPARGLSNPAAAGGEAAATAASLQSWSAADSSSEELTGCSSSHTNGSSARHGHPSKSISELLKAASGSAAAALLCDAQQRGTLRSINVGLHTDAAVTAASVAAAVTAGQVLALHVKHGDAAHALAYSALDLAGKGTAGQQGFGVLLVQGQSHEHVHARTHGHAHGLLSSSGGASLDGQYAAGAAVAAGAAAEQGGLQHQQHGRVATDASMDVGGFGAAFYGLGGWGDDRGTQQHQGVLHKHGQDVWLCVVPLGVAA